MIFNLIISLILTLIIELITSIILGIRNKDDIEVVIFANILTNPIVVCIANLLKLLNNDIVYNSIVILMEVLVVITEFILFKKFLNYDNKKPIIISIINNTTSFLLGIIINSIL